MRDTEIIEPIIMKTKQTARKSTGGKLTPYCLGFAARHLKAKTPKKVDTSDKKKVWKKPGNAIGIDLYITDPDHIIAWDTVLTENGTVIPNGCFQCSKSITSVKIPDGVTNISNFAFAGCENLVSVRLPGTIESIGQMAFFDCAKLKEVTWYGLSKAGSAKKKKVDVCESAFAMCPSVRCTEADGEVEASFIKRGSGTKLISGTFAECVRAQAGRLCIEPLDL